VPEFIRRAIATGCEGQRRPTVSWPPLTASGIFGARFKIMVSGPGQKASAKACASAGISHAQCAMSASGARCTITG
jgi:hypothetical protein